MDKADALERVRRVVGDAMPEVFDMQDIHVLEVMRIACKRIGRNGCVFSGCVSQ